MLFKRQSDSFIYIFVLIPPLVSSRCGSTRGGRGVVLNAQDLEMIAGSASVVPSLQTHFRFQDLLLGDQTFQNDDRYIQGIMNVM